MLLYYSPWTVKNHQSSKSSKSGEEECRIIEHQFVTLEKDLIDLRLAITFPIQPASSSGFATVADRHISWTSLGQ